MERLGSVPDACYTSGRLLRPGIAKKPVQTKRRATGPPPSAECLGDPERLPNVFRVPALERLFLAWVRRVVHPVRDEISYSVGNPTEVCRAGLHVRIRGRRVPDTLFRPSWLPFPGVSFEVQTYFVANGSE